MPYHDVLVLEIGVGVLGYEGLDPGAPAGLVGEFAAREEFPVAVFGQPDGVVGELGAAGVVTARVCQ